VRPAATAPAVLEESGGARGWGRAGEGTTLRFTRSAVPEDGTESRP
jgi:hypothetical protein